MPALCKGLDLVSCDRILLCVDATVRSNTICKIFNAHVSDGDGGHRLSRELGIRITRRYRYIYAYVGTRFLDPLL